MKLTDFKCKSAKPKESDYKIFDGGGLYLLVKKSGTKHWRIKYRFLGKEKVRAIGHFPEVGISEARTQLIWTKNILQEGLDPIVEAKRVKRRNEKESKDQFKDVAHEWLENQKGGWSSDYFETVKARLENNVFPFIGSEPIAKIEPTDILDVLRTIENRGAVDMAARTKQVVGKIFRYGVITRKCKSDPTRDLQEALKKRKVEHYAALQPHEIPELLKAIENNEPNIYHTTMRAVIFSMLTFLRPTEVRHLTWEEVDYENSRIIITGEKMKMNFDLVVPLSKQVVELLKEQYEQVKRYPSNWVFPSFYKRRKPISENTVRLAVHELGFKGRMTAHGFRALASTTLVEVLKYSDKVVDRQLAHIEKNKTKKAYFRMQYIEERTKMMQEWADYLDDIKSKL